MKDQKINNIRKKIYKSIYVIIIYLFFCLFIIFEKKIFITSKKQLKPNKIKKLYKKVFV